MNFSNENKYSSGPLLKKRSCNGRTIRIERLDVNTANRINDRVSRSAKQIYTATQRTMELADKTYSD